MIAIFSYICINYEYSDLNWMYSIDGRKMVPVISPIQLAEIRCKCFEYADVCIERDDSSRQRIDVGMNLRFCLY